MEIALGHFAITVKDMEETVRYYETALGFKKVFEIPRPETGEPWIVYLNVCKGQFLELFYGGTETPAAEGMPVGLNHLCFRVDDLEAAAQKVRDAGYWLGNGPKEGADHNWQAWSVDPNGIKIELMQIDPRSPHAQYS